ncbi:hypothetical protein [Gluconobacter japonicus]|uniref:Uncharacterized protein n=1 Tax=Gluconobacter japonicus TaxID=376620 RepID=A0A9Q2FMD9_GLUJA|nr:hypothetical protein [Gluconobacter japonicus]MBF0871523.1 hypothetical protein [Gluconobacter japonicus]
MHGHPTYRTCNAKGHVGEVRQLGKMLTSIGRKSRRDLLWGSRQNWGLAYRLNEKRTT